MESLKIFARGAFKVFDYSNRDSRVEFFLFALVYFFAITVGFLSEVFPNFLNTILQTLTGNEFSFFGVGQLFFVWLICLAPFWAALARRLNDAGISKLWMIAFPLYLATAIPAALTWDASDRFGIHAPTRGAPELFYMFIGLMALFAVAFVIARSPSQPGPNKYGPNPTEVPS